MSDCEVCSRCYSDTVGGCCETCGFADYYEILRAERKKRYLKTSYNLSPEQYYQKLEEQGFCCPICGESEDRKILVVDHDTECCQGKGKACSSCIRSLCCTDCTTGLKRFYGRPELLDRAADYLRDWEEKRGEY